MIDAQRELADRLGERLLAEWRTAYRDNARHLFLPDPIWKEVDEPIDRASDPGGWLAYATFDNSTLLRLTWRVRPGDYGVRMASPAAPLPDPASAPPPLDPHAIRACLTPALAAEFDRE